MMRPKGAGLVAAIAAVVFAWAPLARAASAMVVAPGAQARAQPTETAAVLQTYATGDKVFVSPEISAGFRRIALPDKKIGFIRDDDVRVEGAPAPVQPLSTAHSLFIVQDIDQLADLTKGDPLLGPRARDLIHTRHAAIGVGVAAGAAALLIAPLALAFTDTQCVGSGSKPALPTGTELHVRLRRHGRSARRRDRRAGDRGLRRKSHRLPQRLEPAPSRSPADARARRDRSTRFFAASGHDAAADAPPSADADPGRRLSDRAAALRARPGPDRIRRADRRRRAGQPAVAEEQRPLAGGALAGDLGERVAGPGARARRCRRPSGARTASAAARTSGVMS